MATTCSPSSSCPNSWSGGTSSATRAGKVSTRGWLTFPLPGECANLLVKPSISERNYLQVVQTPGPGAARPKAVALARVMSVLGASCLHCTDDSRICERFTTSVVCAFTTFLLEYLSRLQE